MQTFYSRLLVALESANLSISEFCHQLQIAPSSVYRWRDGAAPQRRFFPQMAAVLGVDQNWLMTGKGAPEQSRLKAAPQSEMQRSTANHRESIYPGFVPTLKAVASELRSCLEQQRHPQPWSLELIEMFVQRISTPENGSPC